MSGAGILANSASHAMVSGDAEIAQVVEGYVAREEITLTAIPTGTTYAWTLSLPSTSQRPQSAYLTAATGASVAFTPDVGGLWSVTCIVDGETAYAITCDVQAIAAQIDVRVLRMRECTDESVALPVGTARHVYASSTQGEICIKDAGGLVTPIVSGTWTAYSDGIDFGPDFVLGNGTQGAQFRRVGDELWLQVWLSIGSTTEEPPASALLSLPAAAGNLVTDAAKLPFGENATFAWLMNDAVGAALGSVTDTLIAVSGWPEMFEGDQLIIEVALPVKAAP